MKILVTGSAGHLGEALVRVLRQQGHDVVGIDLHNTDFTTNAGSIADPAFVKDAVAGCQRVLHVAALHKPHVATHSKQQFIDSNITGTLNLLEQSAKAGVQSFVLTSTTSVFGDAMVANEKSGAAWITEDVVPIPRNIYGVTKLAAENLCKLYNRNHGLPCIVLRTSRFFPEDDDSRAVRNQYDNTNVKVNEYLYRRADIADIVSAHLAAADRASDIGFERYVISATTPFTRGHSVALYTDAPAVVHRIADGVEAEYVRRGWRMFPSLDRVYDNTRARRELGWQPQYNFATVLKRLREDRDYRSPLAVAVGSRGYHDQVFGDGPYPVDEP